MTIEERFERIEHITAGLAEERIRDREENRQLWRDSQRQINELAVRMTELTSTVTRLAEELQAADRRLGERIDRFAQESRAADRHLEERIEALVSAIGKALPRS